MDSRGKKKPKSDSQVTDGSSSPSNESRRTILFSFVAAAGGAAALGDKLFRLENLLIKDPQSALPGECTQTDTSSRSYTSSLTFPPSATETFTERACPDPATDVRTVTLESASGSYTAIVGDPPNTFVSTVTTTQSYTPPLSNTITYSCDNGTVTLTVSNGVTAATQTVTVSAQITFTYDCLGGNLTSDQSPVDLPEILDDDQLLKRSETHWSRLTFMALNLTTGE